MNIIRFLKYLFIVLIISFITVIAISGIARYNKIPQLPKLEHVTVDADFIIDKSDETQIARKEFIDKLIQKGFFKKIEKPFSVPRVSVAPKFYTLDYKDKNQFIGIVYAYYFDGSKESDMVILIDNLSDKEVGIYTKSYSGLKMF